MWIILFAVVAGMIALAWVTDPHDHDDNEL